ncbi:MAG: DMT family transporter [Tatlockia sp.]|nr:DMT family transporter [Tatlockia sp.]
MPVIPQMNFILFLVLASLWSGSFIAIKVVVEVWPPLFGAAVRVGVAWLSLSILAAIMGSKTSLPFAIRWKTWVIGLFAQGIPFVFLYWGERSISAGLAGILNGTMPIWTFMLALFFLPKTTTLSRFKLLGLLIGLLGVIMIFWPIMTFDKNINTLLGISAILVMSFSYAISNILNEVFLKGQVKIDFLANIYHQHCSSLTFLLLASLIFETWPNHMHLFTSSAPWLATLYLGLLATAFGFLIYYHLIREWDGVRASTVTYIVPILALIWDYLFFHNKPGIYEMIAVVAILSGVILIQFTSYERPTCFSFKR